MSDERRERLKAALINRYEHRIWRPKAPLTVERLEEPE